MNPDKLLGYCKSRKKFKSVEFPELRGVCGFKEDAMPIIKIRAASLDDHIRCRQLHHKASIIALRFLDSLRQQKPLQMEALQSELNDPVYDKTLFEIALFKRVCVSPKFSMKQSFDISEAMPEVINRVANTALQMSSMETSENGS